MAVAKVSAAMYVELAPDLSVLPVATLTVAVALANAGAKPKVPSASFLSIICPPTLCIE